jgi:hypothetical protein
VEIVVVREFELAPMGADLPDEVAEHDVAVQLQRRATRLFKRQLHRSRDNRALLVGIRLQSGGLASGDQRQKN